MLTDPPWSSTASVMILSWKEDVEKRGKTESRYPRLTPCCHEPFSYTAIVVHTALVALLQIYALYDFNQVGIDVV